MTKLNTFTLTDSVYRKKQMASREERERLIKERLAHRARMKTDEAKLDAVKSYIALGGNLTLTAATIGISRNTLKGWKQTTWWTKLVQEFRSAERLKLSAKTKDIMEKAMSELSDRLERGDFIYDPKKGALVRKPVAAKELHRISVDMIDKSMKIDNSIDNGPEEDKEPENKLEKLAEQFAQLAIKAAEKKSPTKMIQVTDVVFAEEKKNHA
jgi:transposase-like protein